MDDRLQYEQQQLEQAQQQGLGARYWTYIKLSGPGWLQSAITLGGGSLAGSLFLGVIGGYEMLWLQPVAMALGVILLAAISYVTLSIESSPFKGIREHINPVLAWGWLTASLTANMVWALPQYSLAYASLTDNLFPEMIANKDALSTKLIVSLIILFLVTLVTWQYEGQGKGVRIYEGMLKILVAVIVLAFGGVALRLTMSGQLPWTTIFAGLVPNPRHLFEPTSSFQQVLDKIQDPDARAYWSNLVLGVQRQRMIAAASAAVGINMTFLMPYALLAKGWNRSFRGLASFDLSTGLLIPFVLATSCVVLAAASQFHTKPYEGLTVEADGTAIVGKDITDEGQRKGLEKKLAELDKSLDGRREAAGLKDKPITQAETEVASMLMPRDTRELAGSLDKLFNSTFVSHTIFGIGVLAMALSTISILMLISGFAVCEALGVERKGWPFRLGVMCAATGVLWPLLWTGNSRAYLAVIIGNLGYTLMPVALITFLFMLNSRRLLGDAMPSGGQRLTWNLFMGIATIVTGSAAIWTAWGATLKVGTTAVPLGKSMVIGFGIAVVLGHFYIKAKHKREEPKS